MIEAIELVPPLSGMAGFTPQFFARRIQFGHAHLKFSVVRVGMTGNAGHPFETVGGCLGCFDRLMAIDTSGRKMPPRQRKPALLMAGQGEQGRLIDVFVVAFLAVVEVGRRRKLAAMNVLVAIRA